MRSAFSLVPTKVFTVRFWGDTIYAGAYAYGRSKTVIGLEGRQKRVRRQVQRRREDWKVLIRDHHQGYIDWEVYQSNQTMIAQNDNAKGSAVRGPIK